MDVSNIGLLETYKSQLSVVDHALISAPTEQIDDLVKLKSNLLEVIQLLQGTSPENQKAHETDIPPSTTQNHSDMDAEFARFQMEISELGDSPKLEEPHCDSTEVTEKRDGDDELLKTISSLEGTKCSAPFSQQWGEKCYHNAIISSVVLEEDDVSCLENLQVKVMFCNPVCDRMKPCPFFLDGYCKFSDEKCRYSHGNEVDISEIRDFKLPDYSNFTRDSVCLAKYDDGLWYKAVVENCLDNNKYVVKYFNFGNTESVDAADLLPLDEEKLPSESETEDTSSPPSSPLCFSSSKNDAAEEHDFDQVRPFLPENPGALGEWEQHTKGMGSKLMAKMGYIFGQGLGKNGEGRLEPVEAIILPKGKSLDKCIQLRDQGGHSCPVSVESKVIIEKEKEEQRMKKQQWSGNLKKRESVFDFINKKISVIKDDVDKLQRKGPPKTQKTRASTKELTKQSFTIAEDIKKAKRELVRLNEALKRNEERNGVIHAQVKRKIAAQKELLTNLCRKEHKINHEMKILKAHEKLTCF